MPALFVEVRILVSFQGVTIHASKGQRCGSPAQRAFLKDRRAYPKNRPWQDGTVNLIGVATRFAGDNREVRGMQCCARAQGQVMDHSPAFDERHTPSMRCEEPIPRYSASGLPIFEPPVYKMHFANCPLLKAHQSIDSWYPTPDG